MKETDLILRSLLVNRVPTQGFGVIESGNNPNGTYIKYADGTMMCWWQDSALTTISTAQSNSFYTTKAVTFPQQFASTPMVVSAPTLNSGVGVTCDPYVITTTGCTLYISNDASGSNAYAGYYAIGRWCADIPNMGVFKVEANDDHSIAEFNFNTSGTYIKYTNGLMICYGVTPAMVNSTTGNRTESFPAPYIENPIVILAPGTGVARGPSGESNTVVYNITMTTFVIAHGHAATIPFMWVSYGRWA